MKPAPFEYHRVHSRDEAIARLSELGEDAKLLAGGQSLVPMMNFRIVRPSALIDITRVPGLDHVARDDGALSIGALVRHATLEHLGPEASSGYEILPRAARFVGHFPIRARGTFGGSLAHADPAGEWCMLALALDAQIVCEGPAGAREVEAADFFQGFMTTALAPEEIVTEVRFPRPWPQAAIQEFARRHGDFAIVAVIAALELVDGRCREARIVIGGVDEVPVRVPEAEEALRGAEPEPSAFEEAAAAAAREIDPVGDLHGSVRYRRELTEVLVRRALHEAVGNGG
ncbi:MAG: xanthine dehydrogenase family protein subunit M [Solirubrobacterales bacterium]|nr:xanthine dehydrogenase family protein subunit M [Solirubrobacterales bacterium]